MGEYNGLNMGPKHEGPTSEDPFVVQKGGSSSNSLFYYNVTKKVDGNCGATANPK